MDRKIVIGTIAASLLAIPAFGAVAYAATTPETTIASPTAAHGAATTAPAKPPYKFGTVKYDKWYAKNYMKTKYGWGDAQYRAVVTIFDHESGWSSTAENSSSGAYGIPQALPGNKMSTAGKDWRTNPETQIRWGLKYIHDTYGTPTNAWSFWQANNWY